MLKKLLLSALISSAAFAAHQIEANVNDNDVEGQLRLDLGRIDNTAEAGTTFVGFRFLSGDNENSSSLGADLDPLMEVSLMVQQKVRGVPGLKVGLGIKGEHTKINEQTFAAIPLGIEAELQLPLNAPMPFYIGGALYYAPSPLAFRDADAYTETRIHLDIEPIDRGRIEIGYRKIDTDLEHHDFTYNDSWYFGLRLDF